MNSNWVLLAGARSDADFAAINPRLAEIQETIQQLETEWEQAAEAAD